MYAAPYSLSEIQIDLSHGFGPQALTASLHSCKRPSIICIGHPRAGRESRRMQSHQHS